MRPMRSTNQICGLWSGHRSMFTRNLRDEKTSDVLTRNQSNLQSQVRLGPDPLFPLSRTCFSSIYARHLLPLLAQDGTVSREGGRQRRRKYLSKQDPKEGREKHGRSTASLYFLCSIHHDDSENTLSITGVGGCMIFELGATTARYFLQQ